MNSWTVVTVACLLGILTKTLPPVHARTRTDPREIPNQLLDVLSMSPPTKEVGGEVEGVDFSKNDIIFRTFLVGEDLSPQLYQKLCPEMFGKAGIHGLCNLYGQCGQSNITFRRCVQSNDCESQPQDCDPPHDDMIIIRKLFRSNESRSLPSGEKNHDDHEIVTNSTNATTRHPLDMLSKNHVQNYTALNSNVDIGVTNTTTTTTTTAATPLQWKSSFSCANFSSSRKFSYFNSCRQFVECVGLVPYVRICASGYKFHPTLMICDKKENVPTNCSTAGNEVKHGNYESQKSHKVAESRGKNVIIKREISSSSSSSSSREGRREMSRRCSVGSDHYIQPHSQYCNKFEICSNGKIQEQTCGLGALFNPLSLVCDLPYNVDCESRRVDFSTYDCQPGDKYKTSHPDKCSQFIECDITGNLHIKDCAPGSLYDYEEGQCVHNYKAKCKKPISLEHDSDNYNSPQHQKRHKRSSSKTLNLACSFNYIAPHPEFCNKFVECEDGRIFIKDCGPGTAYNPRLGQCDWPYNVRQPFPQDCSKYQQCLGSRYVERTCGGTTIFDAEKGKCVFSLGNDDYDADCRRQTFVTPRPS